VRKPRDLDDILPPEGLTDRGGLEPPALTPPTTAPRGGPDRDEDEVLPPLPVLPLRDQVFFPAMVMPLFFSRPKSIHAIEDAMLHGQRLVLVAQRDPNLEEYEPKDIFDVGVLAQSLQVLKLPDGSLRMVAEGQARVRIQAFTHLDPFMKAFVEPIEDIPYEGSEAEALMRTIVAQFERAGELSRNIAPEAVTAASRITDAGRLSDLVASNLNATIEEKQDLLATADVHERLQRLHLHLAHEIEILELERKIHSRVREEIQASQREMYLREQLRVIRDELREGSGEPGEIDEYERRITEAQMPEEAEAHARRELGRLERTPMMSPEGSVIRTYLDALCDLPWQATTDDSTSISVAERVLDEDHYGLRRVKERVLEFLAAKQLAGKDLQSPILCFVGPPGVGKTSIGKSIARALGRKFIRVSLGGVRDEAEIRGHRRTYIGAMPGRIMQAIRQVGVRNPVFMMDEIDKLGMDFRGDPSAALLEVLDPEQNNAFSDHYLEVKFDLSEVMFITTANLLDPVPPALRDRMEVIEFDGYTEFEKLEIAHRYLAPKQLKANGLTAGQLTFPKAALRDIIRSYTREAGVRSLEREIARVCRKVCRKVASAQGEPITRVRFTRADVPVYLGPAKYRFGLAEHEDQVGVAAGLAWTSAGGQVIMVEVCLVPGRGQVLLTGSLGETMKESAETAMTFARSWNAAVGGQERWFRNSDVHVHLPEGAVPKDGPSAGITIATALCSALSRRPVKCSVSMTGEVTLRGRILPVGGVKEKVLAAHRGGLRTVLLPAENEKDIEELPAEVLRDLEIVFVREMSEVLNRALAKAPIEQRAGHAKPGRAGASAAGAQS